MTTSNDDTSNKDKAINTDLMGFSSKITDPRFAKYIKNSNRWALVFSGILALVAIMGFLIYGDVSGELVMPYSLYYGMGIGSMFIVIAMIQVLSRNKDSTWDVFVIDKQIYQRRKWDTNSNSYRISRVYEYQVQSQDGKTHKHSSEDDDTVYNYFVVGDRVRHHKGLGIYEKYDKSRDTFLICSSCASINDIANETCFRCQCPLLK